ncbi:A/G-specific adenine glycosylase [Methanofollis formosanus]|uniref:A/G-specific adenine glycosylase n=1 Tax=Methanofollis formosanus TaxID=299308 RepID=UPI001FE5C89E|nr:A/G-specific adenine glycosylase [Methanofollis formosanus]
MSGSETTSVDEHARLVRAFEAALREEGPGVEACARFRQVICHYFRHHARQMPWRETDDPYRIFVSEVMLQQTQVERVRKKYPEFIERFSDFAALAAAEQREVLEAWQGLGYNRRALALRQAAQTIVRDFGGKVPDDPAVLERLPGIGKATAASVAAFVHNRPTVFIETNVRRLFIHFFFRGREEVRDAEILPLVAMTLDPAHPREFYWAVMDYGTMLKKRYPNPNRRSASYTRQAPFEGSDRQVRGRMLKALLEHGTLSTEGLLAKGGVDEKRGTRVLKKLLAEGFVAEEEGEYRVP